MFYVICIVVGVVLVVCGLRQEKRCLNSNESTKSSSVKLAWGYWLAVLGLCTCLTGCGKDTEENTPVVKEPEVVTEEAVVEESEVVTIEEEVIDVPTSEEEIQEIVESAVEEIVEEPAEEVFEEVTLYEDDNILIKVTNIERNLVSYTVETYVENKTDKELDVQIDSVTCEGMQFTDVFFYSCKVSGNMKSYDEFKIHDYDMTEQHIDFDTFESVDLDFKIIDWAHYSQSYNTGFCNLCVK